MKTFTPKDRSEVDIRVAQEIKNHNDFIYNTGQEIDKLKGNIVSLAIQHDKVVAEAGCHRRELLIEFENIKESLVETVHQMKQRLGDVESKMSYVLEVVSEMKDDLNKHSIIQNESIDLINSMDISLSSLQGEHATQKDYFSYAVSLLKNQVEEKIKEVKEELTPKPPEVDPIKQQLDERFKVWKVDFDGLVREIAILKRAVAYDQKKFENVYTLIERLKAGSKCQEA